MRRINPFLTIAAAIAGLGLPAAAARAQLPQAEPVPGGVAVIAIASAAEPAPQAWFDGRRVLVFRDEDAWHAVVGLPLALRPGAHQISAGESQEAARAVRFDVRAKHYEPQHLTLANRRLVDPGPGDLRRIARDQEILARAFTTWTDRIPDSLSFDLPAAGRFSGAFGLQRFFNNQPRQPHSGLDLAAPEGTPINAPAAGVVMETGDYFFNGLTVILDHGQGLVSMYNHMSRIEVAKGMRVARGQLLGEIGKTGRVTGPHLHWTVSLNNARVDPTIFLPAAVRANFLSGALPATPGVPHVTNDQEDR
jgi:murein DD-endopeptidase MepM/ murein hydrolase activator NlpD